MSRLTFREKQPDTCWQKQIRDTHLSEGAPNVSLDLKRSIVRRVSRRIAEQIILKYEWLGTLPPFCQYFYGLFFENNCAGVTCVASGPGASANPNMYKEFDLRSADEMAYLVRGANVHWSPVGANSKLVSWTCRLLAKDSEAKLVIAYSDTDAGEIGTIYQACNWVCVGRGSTTRQWVSPAGRIFDQKYPFDMARKRGGTRAQWCDALRKAGWVEQESNPKYRYVFILDKNDKALIDRVERMRVPYPKRQPCGGSAVGGTSTDQVESGGSIPTPSL